MEKSEKINLFKDILYAEKFESRKKASQLWESQPEVKAFRKLRKEFDDFKKSNQAFVDPIQWKTIAIGGTDSTGELITYTVGDEWISVEPAATMQASMLNGTIERIEQTGVREWDIIIRNRLGEVSGKNTIRSINKEHSVLLNS